MYHGTEVIPVTYYRDKYVLGLGTYSVVKAVVPETQHIYTCDVCGKRYGFTEQAVEPFYCRCNALIQITQP